MGHDESGTKTAAEVRAFYDRFVAQQKLSGVVDRHHAIVEFLTAGGYLRRDSRVLEVGCGIGTVTGLIAARNPLGDVLAVDISPKSVEVARARLAPMTHVRFQVSDMTDFAASRPFDLIVLPDVLEHIPLPQHADLFRRLRATLRDSGHVVIHIPDPDYLDHVRDTQPELLQPVDQSLRARDLLEAIAATDLDVIHWERYSVFKLPFDYRRIVLSPARRVRSFTQRPPRLRDRVRGRLLRALPWKP